MSHPILQSEAPKAARHRSGVSYPDVESDHQVRGQQTLKGARQNSSASSPKIKSEDKLPAQEMITSATQMVSTSSPKIQIDHKVQAKEAFSFQGMLSMRAGGEATVLSRDARNGVDELLTKSGHVGWFPEADLKAVQSTSMNEGGRETESHSQDQAGLNAERKEEKTIVSHSASIPKANVGLDLNTAEQVQEGIESHAKSVVNKDYGPDLNYREDERHESAFPVDNAWTGLNGHEDHDAAVLRKGGSEYRFSHSHQVFDQPGHGTILIGKALEDAKRTYLTDSEWPCPHKQCKHSQSDDRFDQCVAAPCRAHFGPFLA